MIQVSEAHTRDEVNLEGNKANKLLHPNLMKAIVTLIKQLITLVSYFVLKPFTFLSKLILPLCFSKNFISSTPLLECNVCTLEKELRLQRLLL